jgi:hypothetical protein
MEFEPKNVLSCSECKKLTVFLTVLRIHDILGWIRIWIRGSMPLTYPDLGPY